MKHAQEWPSDQDAPSGPTLLVVMVALIIGGWWISTVLRDSVGGNACQNTAGISCSSTH